MARYPPQLLLPQTSFSSNNVQRSVRLASIFMLQPRARNSDDLRNITKPNLSVVRTHKERRVDVQSLLGAAGGDRDFEAILRRSLVSEVSRFPGLAVGVVVVFICVPALIAALPRGSYAPSHPFILGISTAKMETGDDFCCSPVDIAFSLSRRDDVEKSSIPVPDTASSGRPLQASPVIVAP